KFFLVQYDKGLRVIIHTANLIYADCNNKTQSVFVQDFPRKSSQPEAPLSSPFERDLSEYVRRLGLPPAAARAAAAVLCAHDMSAARAVLVPSVPGYHIDPGRHWFGHAKVSQALAAEAREDPERQNCGDAQGAQHVVAQCSSLGALDDAWLDGEFGESLRGGRRRCSDEPALSLVWPTVEDVQNSIEGWAAGRSIPGPLKNVEKTALQRRWR
ncbi:tyrosyl-DNA phosphodiesterase, partial [Helicosporidium sp. ATCC 50920]